MSSPFYISLYVLCPVVLLAVAALIAFAVSFGVYLNRSKKFTVELADVKTDNTRLTDELDDARSRLMVYKTPTELVDFERKLSDFFYIIIFQQQNINQLTDAVTVKLLTHATELIIEGKEIFRLYRNNLGRMQGPLSLSEEEEEFLDLVDNKYLKKIMEGEGLKYKERKVVVSRLLGFYNDIQRIKGIGAPDVSQYRD